MSLDLSPDRFEIRDDAGRLVLDHATRLIPVSQRVNLANVDVAFPDVSKGVYSIMNSGTGGTSSSDPDGRAWRSYAWGLMINAGTQQGSINLAPITPGTSPNLILANINAYRIIGPNEGVFGPFIKSLPEYVWMPIRSGARLEFNAWVRRIIWFDIAGGFFRLNWKQSTRSYNPNVLDPNWSWSWPDRWLRLKVPPCYQIGSSYRRSGAGELFPPSQLSPPAIPAAASFGSTWRFSNITAWLCQV